MMELVPAALVFLERERQMRAIGHEGWYLPPCLSRERQRESH